MKSPSGLWTDLSRSWSQLSQLNKGFLLAAGIFGFAVVVVALFETEQTIQYRYHRPSKLPPGKTMFEPTFDWQEVKENDVCPPGLEFRMEFETGKNYARLPR